MRPIVQAHVQIAIHGEHIVPRERHAVAIECPPIGLDPLGVVELVEVVLPLEVESPSVVVVAPHLYVVVLCDDGEVLGRVEAVTPGGPGGRPHVHHEVLCFIHVADRLVSGIQGQVELVIYEPGYPVGGPL